MIKISARRVSLALILGATSLVTLGTAHADGITGTDPCPKNMLCSNSATVPSSASAPSIAGTAVQAVLVVLGLS